MAATREHRKDRSWRMINRAAAILPAMTVDRSTERFPPWLRPHTPPSMQSLESMKWVEGQANTIKTMKIGELTNVTGIPPATIRFYEAEGLLPRPARTDSNYRNYGEEDLERLQFVGRCRALGMEMEEIKALLRFKSAPIENCAGVNDLLDGHLEHVKERLREMLLLQRQLKALQEQCRQTTGTDQCGILRELSNGFGPALPGDARSSKRVHKKMSS
jgi:Cd(II)/Pb(II)-responsive transcriptional regulator